MMSAARARGRRPCAPATTRGALARAARDGELGARPAAQRASLKGPAAMAAGCGWGFGLSKAELTDNRVLCRLHSRPRLLVR
jgi:hypothetical protein